MIRKRVHALDELGVAMETMRKNAITYIMGHSGTSSTTKPQSWSPNNRFRLEMLK